jgi:hypothetical protein
VAPAELVAEKESKVLGLQASPLLEDAPGPHSGVTEDEKVAEPLRGEAPELAGQESDVVGRGCLASLILAWTGSVARRQKRPV